MKKELYYYRNTPVVTCTEKLHLAVKLAFEYAAHLNIHPSYDFLYQDVSLTLEAWTPQPIAPVSLDDMPW